MKAGKLLGYTAKCLVANKERQTSIVRNTPHKPIARKSKFHVQNPTKTYKAKHSPEAVRSFAEQCRRQRLANPTTAECGFERLLRENGYKFEREHIIFYNSGTKFIILDFWLPESNIGIEIDGFSHKSQCNYDIERDKYLISIGIRVIRFTNQQVMREPEKVKKVIMEIVNLPCGTI